MKQYVWNIMIAIDQFWNTVLKGDPDETISSRAGKAAQQNQKWACVLCKFLDLFEKGHCIKSIEPDEGKRAVK